VFIVVKEVEQIPLDEGVDLGLDKIKQRAIPIVP
jgi:hypothetical protein